MDPNARLPPISSGTSDGPNYRLPSISNLVHVASEPLDPPRQPPEPTLPRLPSLSQQRHVKQHADLLPNPSSATHHSSALAPPAAESPYALPASPLEQFRSGRRGNHGSREWELARSLQSPPPQSWPLPPARHTTTGTYAGPSSFHSSAPSSHPSERPVMWSHNSYNPRSARTSYPSHQNEPPTSAPHPNAGSPNSCGQNLPSFASTFGPPSAQARARFPESGQDGSQTTMGRSREIESSRLSASYPPDLRRELPIRQMDANPPANTVGTHTLPNHRIASSSHTPQPNIQIGLPQDYEFRPFERPAFSREPLAPGTQPGRDAPLHQPPYPGHPTAGTQEWALSGGPPYRPPTPTSYLPVSQPRSTTTVASNRAHGYPAGDWRADYNSSRVPVVSHSLSDPRSSVPTSSSRSNHAPQTLPTQPGPRSVPSHPYPLDTPIPSAQETRGLNFVSPPRPSRGRGARSKQQGSRRVRSDVASDATRVASQPRKRQRRNEEKAFDPTALAQPPPMLTITPAQPLEPQAGTSGALEGTPGGLQPIGPIPPRPRRLILQTCPEDLRRVQARLTQESQAAAARNRHMKKIHEHSKIIRDFARYYVKYKPLNVPQPPQSEVDELAHRVVCIIELCKDIIFKARRQKAEQAGRDPDKEIASANAMLSAMPTLRQVLPATASSGASNRGANAQSTSGDPPNLLKRDHDSMVNGTAGPPVKSQQEIEMELIRSKRMAAQSGVKGKYTKRNKRAAPPQKCTSCGTKETPEWRRGPDGQRSLCNACGLHYAKLIKNQRGIWIGAGDPPPIDVMTLRQVTKIGVQPVFNDKGELVIPGFYRVPAAQAQSVFIRAPGNTLPVAGAGGSGVGMAGGGDSESSGASAVSAAALNQTCGPSAGEVPLDGLPLVVDEDEDLTMPAGKRRRWKAAPPEAIASATRAASASASTQPALPPQTSHSAEPEQCASINPEDSQVPNADTTLAS